MIRAIVTDIEGTTSDIRLLRIRCRFPCPRAAGGF